ncbi:MAG: transcription antitermination factor NusB [Patescibacteria group bacterium]
MANRHLARSLAMQTLFEWDFNKGKINIDEILERNKKEFAPGIEEDGFAKKILDLVLKHKDEIDDIIQKAAPEWPIAQIAPIDRNVLRLGLSELLFGDRSQVPPKVAINEAIELAKTFGGTSSGKFVNGVLGTVYKEIGEPGKDDFGKKFGAQDLEKLPKEELGGAVVFRKEKGKIFIALVHDVFGFWTLSKGHLEKGEDIESGTKREIEEELGLKDIKIVKKIGDNEYIASDPETGPTRRHVNYFLIESLDKDIKLESSGGLDDAQWFQKDEVNELKIYDDVRPLIEKGIKEIK